jgi:hypothetical protein
MHEKMGLPILVYGFEVRLLRTPQTITNKKAMISGNREILATVLQRKSLVEISP